MPTPPTPPTPPNPQRKPPDATTTRRLVILAGLPGTGKSTLARALAGRLPAAAIVSKDEIRAAVFDAAITPYAPAQDDFVMELMLQAAAAQFNTGANIVLLNGRTFAREAQRQRVRDFASQNGFSTSIIECVCPEHIALLRIAADYTHPAVDRTIDLYHRVGRYFAPIPEPKLVVDTSRPVAVCVEEALAAMGTSWS